MTLLAIDTSTGPASLALTAADGSCIAMHEDAEAMKQSQRLVRDVNTLVRAHLPSGYAGLQAIVTTHGPGGFTGIRIGLATARGLALAANLPLIGLSTLEVFAWEALENTAVGTAAITMVDAYRGQAYCQPFCRGENTLEALSEAEAVDYEALAQYAAQWPDAIRIGNPKTDVAELQHSPLPHALHAGSYAAFLLRNTEASALASTHKAEAFYIRPPDAKPQKPFLS